MGSIIVGLPKLEDANKIGDILKRQGLNVDVICNTASEILREMNSRDYGIVICGSRFPDMETLELAYYMPDYFDMIVMASEAVLEHFSSNVIKLVKPFAVTDLTNTVEMLSYQQSRRFKPKSKPPVKRTKAENEIITKAKLILMERNDMTEPEAFRYIQKCSMDSGTNMTESAEMIMMLNCTG